MTEGAEGAGPAGGCDSCGAAAGTVDEDGYCGVCGRRVARPLSDHVEQVEGDDLAAVSDRGRHHATNQDRCGMWTGCAGALLVVCDGVSRSVRPEQAAALVVETVGEALASELEEEELAAERAADLLVKALAQAQRRLEETGAGLANNGATTAVAALVSGRTATVAWVGDSRAYWLGPEGMAQLTTDHSWEREAAAAGEIWEADDPRIHVIVRWMGAGAGEQGSPEVVQQEVGEGGSLLLCSDGLWNYAAATEQIAEQMMEAAGGGEGPTALEVVQRLVEFALQCGGEDNVTVALLRVRPENGEQAGEQAGE